MQKKIPMRMCIGCGENKPKKELIRIVKSSEGEISLDMTGKKSGRGAYICPNQDCFTKAIKNHRLEKSFSCKISPEIYEELKYALSEIARNS